MDEIKTSIFSKIMAVLAFATAVLALYTKDKDIGAILDYGIILCLIFILVVSICVFVSYSPRSLFSKILILILSVITGALIGLMFSAMLQFGLFPSGCMSMKPIETLVLFTACFSSYWTISIMLINIFNMNPKRWTIFSACLFILITIYILNLTGERYYGRISANEASTIGSLKAIQAAETIWKQTSMSGTGKPDYWTYDVSAMYRMLKADAPCSIINIDLAKSDTGWHKDGIFGSNVTQDWNSISITLSAKTGYYVQTMLTDEDGKPYNQNELNGIKVANPSRFAFVAYPAVYGSSGERTFIINEQGIVYTIDCGSDDAKIILKWPGKYPELIKGPGGKYWAPTGS